MMAAFRPTWTGEMPAWLEPFRRTVNAAIKYVVSSTLDEVDWNAEFVRGDQGKAVQQPKQELGMTTITHQPRANKALVAIAPGLPGVGALHDSGPPCCHAPVDGKA